MTSHDVVTLLHLKTTREWTHSTFQQDETHPLAGECVELLPPDRSARTRQSLPTAEFSG